MSVEKTEINIPVTLGMQDTIHEIASGAGITPDEFVDQAVRVAAQEDGIFSILSEITRYREVSYPAVLSVSISNEADDLLVEFGEESEDIKAELARCALREAISEAAASDPGLIVLEGAQTSWSLPTDHPKTLRSRVIRHRGVH